MKLTEIERRVILSALALIERHGWWPGPEREPQPFHEAKCLVVALDEACFDIYFRTGYHPNADVYEHLAACLPEDSPVVEGPRDLAGRRLIAFNDSHSKDEVIAFLKGALDERDVVEVEGLVGCFGFDHQAGGDGDRDRPRADRHSDVMALEPA
jgi:hypothetical protein